MAGLSIVFIYRFILFFLKKKLITVIDYVTLYFQMLRAAFRGLTVLVWRQTLK